MCSGTAVSEAVLAARLARPPPAPPTPLTLLTPLVPLTFTTLPSSGMASRAPARQGCGAVAARSRRCGGSACLAAEK